VESIRKMGGGLKVRAGAEGPRRAADGGCPSSVPGRCRGPSPPMGPTAAQAALPSGARQEPGPVGCLERLNTPLPYVALAPRPASHLPWPGPGASQSRAPLGLPSPTPTPGACLYSSPRRTRPSRTSSSATRPCPLAAASASSAPFWPLPPSPRSPPPHLLGRAAIRPDAQGGPGGVRPSSQLGSATP